MVFDSAGNFFFLTNPDDPDNFFAFDGTITKIDRSGNVTTFFTNNQLFFEGLAVDGANNLFVTASDAFAPQSPGTIYKITPDGVVSTFGSTAAAPWGLACDSSGNLYVAEHNDGTSPGVIYKFSPMGVRSVFAGTSAFSPPFTSTTQPPAGVAVDASGNVFASATDGTTPGTILKFSPDGSSETVFASGLSIEPRGIAFDADGNLFVA